MFGRRYWKSLSGEERSLVALALRLAILYYDPAPFCVLELDEIDAGLVGDQAASLGRLIKERLPGVQLICVSRKEDKH